MSLYGAAAYADDAMPVYDLGSDDVYDTYETPKEEAAPPEPKEAEPAPVPEEQPPQTFAGGQVSTTRHMGALGDKKILDVPFNVVGISSKTIEDQQAKDVSDVTSNDSSVSDQTLSGASSAWNIRGFKTTQQDVQWDGIYGVGPRFYSGVEAVERVDVIKGPSALLGGLPPNGTVGGTINFVPKRAEDTPTRDLTVSLGAGAQLTETSMSAFAAIGLRDTTMDYLYNTFQLINKSGKSTVAYQYNNHVNKADTEEVGIRGKVRTGDIKHELVLSADRVHYTRYMANRKIKTALGKNYSYTTDFYHPQFQGYPAHDS